MPVARSTEREPGPVNKITSAITPKASGSSKPFFEAKKPLGMCTLAIATPMSMTRPAAQKRVRKPRTRQMPPTNSVTERTHARIWAGSRPSFVSMPATPAIPGPPNAPRTFCDPCIMKAKPRNNLRIRTANRSNPSSRCGTDALPFSRARQARDLEPRRSAWIGRVTAARMPVAGPLSQDSVSLRLSRTAELVAASGAVASSPPETVADDRQEPGRHDQEESPLAPQPFEHLLDLVAEDMPEHDPQGGISQRARQVVQHEAAIREMSAAAQDGGEQSHAGRVASEHDGRRAEAPEVSQGVFHTALRAEREPAVERQQRFASARARQVDDVVAGERAERGGDDGEGQLDRGAREGAREDEHDAAGKRNTDRVDRAHDEDGQIEVGDQEQHEPIGRCFHRLAQRARKLRTIRRNSASRSWWSQWPARPTPTPCGGRQGAAVPSQPG